MSTRSRKAVAVFAVVVVAAAATIVAVSAYFDQPRREWKNQAVADITRLAADSQWLLQECAGIQKQCAAGNHRDATWRTGQLILTRDGQWLIFRNKCSKEDRRINDIFIAKASNGKWYYSTYHFCIGMQCLEMDGQPPDLDTFIKSYALREFDGRSDEALKSTWPAQ